MSLEATIQENTNAIRELIAALSQGRTITGKQVAAVVAEAPSTAKEPRKGKAQATVATNGASSTPAISPSADAAAHEKPAAEHLPSSAAASVSYEDVKKAIITLSQDKGRDAVVALLGEFGATTGPQLKPEQFSAFVAKATEHAEV